MSELDVTRCTFCGAPRHPENDTPSCLPLRMWADWYDDAWQRFKVAGFPGYEMLPVGYQG